MRRLAAKDSDIDLINMDTIWTPEFAEAGWLRELKGAEKAEATDDVLPGPLKSVEWKGKTYAVPLNTNAQLLWYRKDLVPKPPETWDEMIAMAKKLPADRGPDPGAGQQLRGLRRVVQQPRRLGRRHDRQREGTPALDASAVKAAQIIKDVATSGRADPSLVDQPGGPGAARLRGRPRRLRAQLALRLRLRPRSGARRARRPRRSSRTWARRAGPASTRASRAACRSAAPTSASRTTASNPDLATQAALCMTEPQVAGRRRRSTRACRR